MGGWGPPRMEFLLDLLKCFFDSLPCKHLVLAGLRFVLENALGTTLLQLFPSLCNGPEATLLRKLFVFVARVPWVPPSLGGQLLGIVFQVSIEV